MTDVAARYAIYFAPAPDSALWRLGSAWIGRDAANGAALAHPGLEGIAPDRIPEITAFPRRYGFHATLRAPFEIVAGAGEAELIAAADAFAVGRTPFAMRLGVEALPGFLALTILEEPTPMDALHADLLPAFEPFRAPLSETDRARRRPDRLTHRQRAHLDRWGYPHVLEDFSFHMTLAGPVDAAEAATAAPALARYFDDALREPILVDAISLFAQSDRDAPFILAHRSAFTGA